LLIAAALFAVYIVLGILYESFVHPITILLTLPPASVGTLLALKLLGLDLTMMAIIGLIMLIGIVKKNAIMMIDFALERMRKEENRPRRPRSKRQSPLPPDHDDHDVRRPRNTAHLDRNRRRSRFAATARACSGVSESGDSQRFMDGRIF
jgi:hypothetical protein